MTEQGKVVSINVSKKKGGKKFPVKKAYITFEGIKGDAHSGKWHRQVSLLSYDSMKSFNEKAKKKLLDSDNSSFSPTVPGDFGENITTSNIDLKNLKIGDRLIIVSEKNSDLGAEENVILEVTQLGKDCPAPCSIYYRIGSCIMPQEGIFCKVVKTGRIKTGDKIYLYN